GKSLVYSQGIVAIAQEDRPIDPQKDTAQEAKVLLSENMYLASADTKAKPVDRQELVIGVPYRNRVVLTNPTGNRLMLQILMQVPQGSIPLEAGRNVVVKEFFLDPFSTVETSHVFYFPSAGPFQHYGAQASSEGKYLTHVASSPLRVLEAPLNIDDSSWEYLADWGSNDQVLAALDKVNIQEIDFDRIAWRMQDGAFWKQVLDKLDAIGIYKPTLWAYSLQHRDERRLREFFESDERIVGHAFPYFDHPLMHVDQESRLGYEHLDFRPIVVARTVDILPTYPKSNARGPREFPKGESSRLGRPIHDERSPDAVRLLRRLLCNADRSIRSRWSHRQEIRSLSGPTMERVVQDGGGSDP
ncbi:MAG: hypothetical protein NT168_02915, partial [Planctomycetota bacterium]|nr:hypothetical protein [Planctomycetota bacterium]